MLVDDGEIKNVSHVFFYESDFENICRVTLQHIHYK